MHPIKSATAGIVRNLPLATMVGVISIFSSVLIFGQREELSYAQDAIISLVESLIWFTIVYAHALYLWDLFVAYGSRVRKQESVNSLLGFDPSSSAWGPIVRFEAARRLLGDVVTLSHNEAADLDGMLMEKMSSASNDTQRQAAILGIGAELIERWRRIQRGAKIDPATSGLLCEPKVLDDGLAITKSAGCYRVEVVIADDGRAIVKSYELAKPRLFGTVTEWAVQYLTSPPMITPIGYQQGRDEASAASLAGEQ